ncbi:MAG TPA: CFI-box-CTERM domain-containing protein, partial [Dehalococcoidia bacterium]|nr:CFI-box-CTERM domain-containing protein [Dehalococcoidia bacterium]
TGSVDTVVDVKAVPTTVTMNGHYAIKANFEVISPTVCNLTVSSTAGGSVTAPGQGTFVYDEGTVVTLVATPDARYRFAKWSGDVAAIANINAASTTITTNADHSVKANFEAVPLAQYSLTVSSTAGGSVVTPGQGTFPYYEGMVVPLMATPNIGYQFVNWSGDVGSIANPNAASTTVTMNSSHSIMANFSAGACFIATAAYGTPMAEEIQILREFRDEYLRTNPVGSALVDTYYRVSPPIAAFITEHPSLKPVVRAGLVPAVAMSTIAVSAAPVEKVAIACMLVLFCVALAVWATRRRRRGSEHI